MSLPHLKWVSFFSYAKGQLIVMKKLNKELYRTPFSVGKKMVSYFYDFYGDFKCL